MKRRKLRLRKWGSVILCAASLASVDPLDAALDYSEQLSKTAIVAEENSLQPPALDSSAALPSLLQRIRSCESWHWRNNSCGYNLSKYNYRASNPSGCEGYGCGGAYQLHARYATVWAEQAGYSGMPSNAALWPPHIQDAVAIKLFHSTTPAGYHWCHWASYC